MRNYLALIRKADFNDLYRYGYIRIDSESSVEFHCAPEALSSHSEVFNELAKNANAFDNAFVYILVHFTLPDETLCNRVSIEEVQHIYPLDIEAYKEFSTTFDTRIQICKPLWNNAVLELQKKWAVASSIKGTYNIWKIFGITYPIEEVQKIIPNSIIEQTIDVLYSDVPICGEFPLLVYLLRYERHSFYTKNTKGYFMDAIHTYCNFAKQKEAYQEEVEHTETYGVISKYKDTEKYNGLVEKGLKDKKLKIFMSRLSETCPEFPFFEVAPLFLALRNMYAEGIPTEKCSEKYTEYIKLVTAERILAIAMYLLGIVLGHEKTYDALYETLPLPIFRKDYIKPIRENEATAGQKTSEIPSKNMYSDKPKDYIKEEYIEISDGLFPPKRIKFPFLMGKLYKGGDKKGTLKEDTIKKITNKEEYETYKSKGYIIINNEK